MPIKLPRIKIPSLPKLDAALDAWRVGIEYACNIEADPPLTIRKTPAGPVLGYGVPLRKFVQLGSAATTPGSYHASEVYPAAAGVWTAALPSWTGVVWEYNLNAGITGTVYTAVEWCGPTSDWRFQMGTCS